MRKYLFIVILFLLSGCVLAIPPGEPLPVYVVLLTHSTGEPGTCTGILMDAETVLTMRHCVVGRKYPFSRVATQTGLEGYFEVAADWEEYDIALLKTDRRLVLPRYAEFGIADKARQAMVFGSCPMWSLNVPRYVHYVSDEDITTIRDRGIKRHTQHWRSLDGRFCGGDSGGPVIQDGKVIGIAHAIEVEWYWIVIGTELYIIPAEDFMGVIDELSDVPTKGTVVTDDNLSVLSEKSSD